MTAWLRPAPATLRILGDKTTRRFRRICRYWQRTPLLACWPAGLLASPGYLGESRDGVVILETKPGMAEEKLVRRRRRSKEAKRGRKHRWQRQDGEAGADQENRGTAQSPAAYPQSRHALRLAGIYLQGSEDEIVESEIGQLDEEIIEDQEFYDAYEAMIVTIAKEIVKSVKSFTHRRRP